MDVGRLINKALVNADIHRILGGGAKIMNYAELGNLYEMDQLLPGRRVTALYFTKTSPIEGTGQPYLSITVSARTLTPTASSQIVS